MFESCPFIVAYVIPKEHSKSPSGIHVTTEERMGCCIAKTVRAAVLLTLKKENQTQTHHAPHPNKTKSTKTKLAKSQVISIYG